MPHIKAKKKIDRGLITIMREERRLTQEDLAKRAGVSRLSVKNHEDGQAESPGVLRLLFKTLKRVPLPARRRDVFPSKVKDTAD